MRGKAEIVLLWYSYPGITPAYAGKSVQHGAHEKTIEDHPRVCGEKTVSAPVDAKQPGSPPRMRGKGIETDAQLMQARITPAYAGKRSAIFKAVDRFRDHPRVCGEKAFLVCWPTS